MIIFFEDGRLRMNDMPCSDWSKETGNSFTIDAQEGITACLITADNLLKLNNPEIEIYTNCLELLHGKYAWNKKLGLPEIYIRSTINNEFTCITNLTNRELKEGHNFAKLYLAGEFDLKSKRYSAYLASKETEEIDNGIKTLKNIIKNKNNY